MIKKCQIKVLMLLLYVLSYCNSAKADVVIYPIEVGVGNKGAAQIQVLSRSEQVSFVRVTEKKIINPGTSQEKEISSDMTADGALVITPQKLAVSPGGQRLVRLVAVNLPEKETTWRVYFEGVSENEFNGITDPAHKSKTTAQVGVSIIWGALVHVAPRNPVVSLKIDGRTGMFINDGTVRIPLTQIGECTSTGGCTWHKEGATVYPDTKVKIKSFSYHPGSLYKVRFKNWLEDKNEEISLPVTAGSE
ncbi:fimbrial protein [Phytobacter diazotrophicus]|uniref:fimbrial protein n=1 Tax=Enterobacteriaceae TaxID=543 RepID=UPI001C993619|nr:MULTISPECIES: fimbrial protein [Enterobacteriaceae]MBY6257787.1 fimbrial protein [Phytobacter diazotrophicus]